MHAPEHGAPRKWLTLLAMTGSLCMIMLDISVVGVSLPTIQADLGLGEVQTQWVVNAYILALASLVALGGRAADTFGKVPAFVTGMLIFAVASAGCAMAKSGEAMIAWRAVQGAAAALMQPASASLVVGSFAPGERGKAMAVYAGIPLLFLVSGPPIGGSLTQHAGWPWAFWINVPVAAVAVALTWVARPVDMRRAAAGHDPVGAVLLLAGLPCLVFGLMETHGRGWSDPTVLVSLGVAAVALPVFVRWELRHPSPLLALSLFRDRRILADAIVLAAMQFAMNGLVIFGSAYMQAAMGMDPMEAGMALLPMLVPVLVVVHVAGRLYDRHGVGRPTRIGTALATLGMGALAMTAPFLSYPPLSAGMLMLGVGIGFVMSPTNVDAMQRAGPDRRAQASGLVQTIRQVGGTLGVAVVGSAILARQAWMVDDHVRTRVPLERASDTTRLLREAAQAQPEAMRSIAADPSLASVARDITARSVAMGWGISTVALALGALAAWRGLREEPARTL